MPTPFPKTDLAKLIALPTALRALALLSALRFAAESDLREAGVPDSEMRALARRSLVFRLPLQRRLTDAETTEVYAASRRGAVELARALALDAGTVPSSTRKSCARTPLFLDHALGTASFALALARALAAPDAPASLRSWEAEGERLADSVRLAGGGDRQPLVADGLAVLRGPRGPEGLLVEIDRGTERPGYLGRKYAGYLEWWRSGGPERKLGLRALRLLTVAPDAKRTARLLAECREATGGAGAGLTWFASEDEILARGLLAPVWSNLRAAHVPLWSPSAAPPPDIVS